MYRFLVTRYLLWKSRFQSYFSFIFHRKIVLPEGRLQSRLNADLAPPVNECVNMYKPVENKNFDYLEFPRQPKFLLV
jgi:hypothetical protein